MNFAMRAACLVVLFAANVRAADNEPFMKAPVGAKTKPLAAEWEYSRDEGKTFGKDAPPGAVPKNREGIAPLVFRGTFEIADPAQVAGLWVRIAETSSEIEKAAICDGDLIAASGGYWKDLGFCPTLLNAKLTLNGKQLKLTNGPMLYFWLPVHGELKKGKNVIELAGDCYSYWGTPQPTAITARLVVAEPQRAEIVNGPILGDFGDGYFTLACRTTLPADLIVEATPTDPPGKSIVVTSTNKIWHRVKVDVPRGTKAVSYSVKSKVGPHESAGGPFSVKFPGADYRFVALGNVSSHPSFSDLWAANVKQILKTDPAFVVNTGNCSEHATWEFDWDRRYCVPAAKLLSSRPTLYTPCNRDLAGAIQELHVTPAADGYSHNWSKVVGPVRFIGLDGNQTWKADSENTRWLEKELAVAKEKFVVALDGYPGYSSGRHNNKPRAGSMQTREVVLPLLGKYKATALLSGMDPDYERCEPTPDKGCTQIVTGSAGKENYRYSGSAIALNPFAKGKSADWGGADGIRSFCVFDVKGDTLELRVIALTEDPAAEPRTLDKKTFSPR